MPSSPSAAASTPAPYTTEDFAHCLRFLSADMVEKAKSGHPGMPLGMADVVSILWREFLVFDAATPLWPNRDRFILSAGHGSALLYSLLYLTGFDDMTQEELQNFRQLHSRTAGHPEYGLAAGIETTTGPLGQGFATAVGMALAEKILKNDFSSLIDYKIYVVASDGDLMEGISQEALSLAGHLKINNLIVLYDDNQITIDGSTNLSFSDNATQRFEASHWTVFSIDGHDEKQIRTALQKAQKADKPVLIRCNTVIAKGAPTKKGSSHAHGAPLGTEELHAMRESLGWSCAPFDIPEQLLTAWRHAGARHRETRVTWEKTLATHPLKDEFVRRQHQKLPSSLSSCFEEIIAEFKKQPVSKATRQLSQSVLTRIAPQLPELIGGSADLMGSTNTHAPSQDFIEPSQFKGQFIHYGVREHAMAAVMNGLSLSGLRPYGGTFLIFSDYLRPALRLSALMHQPVIYVLTHDSIGLGEDGPTHQPIEHLVSLRAMPNLNVFRPADAVEVAECWKIALEETKTPSVIALTRQTLPPVRQEDGQENLCRRGGYILREASQGAGKRDVTLLSTGSEVSVAIQVADELEKQGISTAIVSLPCFRLFDQQSDQYRQQVLGETGLRVAIEAASSFSWHRYTRPTDLLCCVDTFGASAPAPDLYANFGLTVESIVGKILETNVGSI